MSTQTVVAPAGYERFTIGETVVVARAAAASGVRLALAAAPTLHDWAAIAPGAEGFQGRGTAYGVRLPGGAIDVVVRHARRGGVFRSLRGDRYVWPGRAPWELETALRLQDAGVRTPDVVAYALYPAGPGLCRYDVLTKRLPIGSEFPTAWAAADVERRPLLIAVSELLRDLAAAGAQHADLNAKNLYLARDGGRWHAWVLDVDRVRFRTPNDPDIAADNLARLVRSMRKLRKLGILDMGDDAIAQLDALATGSG